METFYVQKWNFKKILYYIAYRFFAKHLLEYEEFGIFGRSCHKFRSYLCKALFKKSGTSIGVGKGARFGNGSNIIMKDYANIGAYSFIGGPRGLLTIGKHVMMGQNCTIILQNHKYLKEHFEGFEGKDIMIGDHSWIGGNVTILPGVKIGNYAIIGAGSVVTKDIPKYAIAVGNPAVVKKYRN